VSAWRITGRSESGGFIGCCEDWGYGVGVVRVGHLWSDTWTALTATLSNGPPSVDHSQIVIRGVGDGERCE